MQKYTNFPNPPNPFFPTTSILSDMESLQEVTIGNAVTELPEGIFQNCSALEKVEFGSMLEAVPANAFKGCSKLSDIVIPRNVTSIGANAFDGCSAAGNIAIGSGISEIGELAFNEVNAAANVCVAAVTPPAASNNSFSNYNVPLFVPAGSTDAYYNCPRCWYRFEPEALKEITEVTIDTPKGIVDMEAGESIQLTAAFAPADATLPYIFWRSTNPDVATVDCNGNVTFLPNVLSRGSEVECQIIAETLYADAPVASVTIKGIDSGIEVVMDDDYSADGLGNRPNDIYTLQGICLKRDATREDINALAPGLYIVGGRKMIVR